MKRYAAWALACLVMASANAGDTKKFDFVPEPGSNGSASPAGCAFGELQLPEKLAVFATGAYGGKPAGFQIDQSGHEATRFDIAVNSPDKPVVLMLGAYEPSVWNIGWSQGTQILAVLVSGYHRQAVAGLPKTTPIINSSYDNKGACGYFYVSDSTMGALNPMSKRVFGRPVSMVFPVVNGKVVVGNPLAAGTALRTSSDTTLDSLRDPSAPLAGPAGLADAVRKGHLRPASAADAQAWANAVAKNTPDSDLPPVAGQGKTAPRAPTFYGGYVVLKAFTFPAGLYGAHSSTFFVPKGVPAPQGNPGHSTVFDYNTLVCSGVGCNH
jgi:hypothetical protein